MTFETHETSLFLRSHRITIRLCWSEAGGQCNTVCTGKWSPSRPCQGQVCYPDWKGRSGVFILSRRLQMWPHSCVRVFWRYLEPNGRRLESLLIIRLRVQQLPKPPRRLQGRRDVYSPHQPPWTFSPEPNRRFRHPQEMTEVPSVSPAKMGKIQVRENSAGC